MPIRHPDFLSLPMYLGVRGQPSSACIILARGPATRDHACSPDTPDYPSWPALHCFPACLPETPGKAAAVAPLLPFSACRPAWGSPALLSRLRLVCTWGWNQAQGRRKPQPG